MGVYLSDRWADVDQLHLRLENRKFRKKNGKKILFDPYNFYETGDFKSISGSVLMDSVARLEVSMIKNDNIKNIKIVGATDDGIKVPVPGSGGMAITVVRWKSLTAEEMYSVYKLYLPAKDTKLFGAVFKLDK